MLFGWYFIQAHSERPCIGRVGWVVGVSLTEAARNVLYFVPFLSVYVQRVDLSLVGKVFVGFPLRGVVGVL